MIQHSSAMQLTTFGRIILMLLGVLLFESMIYMPGFCEEQPAQGPSLDSTSELIELLKEKKVITEEEAERFIRRHREKAASEKQPAITIVPEEKEQEYLEKVTREATEQVGKDIEKVKKDQDYMSDELMRRSRVTDRNVEALEKRVTEEVGAQLRKSSWAQRLRWGGDIRLRYQGEYYDENNDILIDPADPTGPPMNTTEDRHRGRIRVRLGVKATVVESKEVNVGKVEAGVTLATGNERDPISTNDTLGDYYNKDGLYIDQAYLKWTYSPELPVWGSIPQAALSAGRIPNPYFYTDLVWDSDLNFEGVAFHLITDTQLEKAWKGFLTVGAFPLQEVEQAADKYLYAGQAGFEFKRPMGFSLKLGIAYYNFENVTGEPNDPLDTLPTRKDYTAPLYQQKGNTLFNIAVPPGVKLALASDYDELNITGKFDLDIWFPIHVILTGDYVKNLGFDKEEVAARTQNPDQPEETEGYLVGLTVGYPAAMDFGDWNLSLSYKYLQRDAVIDAFTDSDFHMGGTNAQGWILGGEFGLHKNLWLRARWLTADEISGSRLAIDVFQFDLNARF